MLILSPVIITVCNINEGNAYPITSDHHRVRCKRGNPGLQQVTPKFGTMCILLRFWGVGWLLKRPPPLGWLSDPRLGALVRDFTPKTGTEDQGHVTIHLRAYDTRLPRRLRYACMHAHVTSGSCMQGCSRVQRLHVRRPGSRQA